MKTTLDDVYQLERAMKGSAAAFSLVELMIVVGIIGILSSLAVPKFRVFRTKARRTEAYIFLEHLYKLQTLYRNENGTYLDMQVLGINVSGGTWQCDPNVGLNPPSALGFNVSPCGVGNMPRYGYTCTVATISGFECHARTGSGASNFAVPGCFAPDWLTNDETKATTFVSDALTFCPP